MRGTGRNFREAEYVKRYWYINKPYIAARAKDELVSCRSHDLTGASVYVHIHPFFVHGAGRSHG
jgi:hypothetical protein